MAAREIVQNLEPQLVNRNRREKLVSVSFKPTGVAEGIVREIASCVGWDESTSQYIRRMAMSYCTRRCSEREQAVYADRYQMLKEACASGQTVAFTTTRDQSTVHVVRPYSMAVGSDERFNYLLCQEEMEGAMAARTYRLCRILHPHFSKQKISLDGVVTHRLDTMARQAPQFAIESDEECVVRLSDRGIKTYQIVSHGRPAYLTAERMEEDWLYHFDCSHNQLFLYFRRFGPGEAEVLSPPSLREQIIAFHRGALEMYGS